MGQGGFAAKVFEEAGLGELPAKFHEEAKPEVRIEAGQSELAVGVLVEAGKDVQNGMALTRLD